VLLLGAAVALALFAWLLSFHPSAGRAYAAYVVAVRAKN
jgi:drug/metabolite transporter superfamily protein YnfA